MRNLRNQSVLVLMAVASSGLMLVGQQQAAAGRYTAAQAAAGRDDLSSAVCRLPPAGSQGPG